MHHQKSKHVRGGAVAVAAIIGSSKILLIKEITKPTPHFWKLVSETVEPGEPLLNTLWSGIREEAGLNLRVNRDERGSVTAFTDGRAEVKELCPPHRVEGRFPHTRHFYGVLTSDVVISSLSGQQLRGDENEAIETCAFDLSELDAMVDFLPQHRELIKNMGCSRN